MKKVAIGLQSFEKVRKRNVFYVDKTHFIREWWERGDDVTLIARPRRFGKTLNMSTLETFFSTRYNGRGDLFEGLEIWKDEEYRAMQGTWPVIFLSFASVKETTYEGARKKLNQILTDCRREFNFILDAGILSEEDISSFKKINDEMDDEYAASALNRLCIFFTQVLWEKGNSPVG